MKQELAHAHGIVQHQRQEVDSLKALLNQGEVRFREQAVAHQETVAGLRMTLENVFKQLEASTANLAHHLSESKAMEDTWSIFISFTLLFLYNDLFLLYFTFFILCS